MAGVADGLRADLVSSVALNEFLTARATLFKGLSKALLLDLSCILPSPHYSRPATPSVGMYARNFTITTLIITGVTAGIFLNMCANLPLTFAQCQNSAQLTELR